MTFGCEKFGMTFRCEKEVKPGSRVLGRCTDCSKEFSIVAPRRNKSTIFSCPYCGTTNTFTNKKHKSSEEM